MHSRRSKAFRGTSLVEILVALTLLAGVLVSTLDLSIRAGESLAQSRRRTTANALGSDIMETVRGIHFRQTWELVDTEPELDAHEVQWDSDALSKRLPEDLEGPLASWTARARELPEGRLRLRIRGLRALGPDGLTSPLRESAVLHVMVSVSWRARGRLEELVLQTFRS